MEADLRSSTTNIIHPDGWFDFNTLYTNPLMKEYYECHVTMLGDPDKIRPEVEANKWKFSAIDGDPVLGEGIKCYATRMFNIRMEESVVLRHLMNVAEYLSGRGCKVLRRKVERVIYDDRSSMVKCTGACPECHIDDYEEQQLKKQTT